MTSSEGGGPQRLQPSKPTSDDAHWLAYGARLREQTPVAYNEAAKILVTATALFLAFYGTMALKVITDRARPMPLLLIPPVLLVVGVACCVGVLLPLGKALVLIEVTALKDYFQIVMKRKRDLLLWALIALGLGVFLSLAFLFVL